jgi:hypothetical protein
MVKRKGTKGQPTKHTHKTKDRVKRTLLKPGDEFCCSKAKSGIKTDSLSATLARFLLFNFCVDVFWYSCLALANLKFDDFIDKNKHTLFHKLANNVTCCQCQQDSVISEKPNPLFQFPCPQGSVISEKPNLLFQFQWNILFTFNPDVTCSGPSTAKTHSITYSQ